MKAARVHKIVAVNPESMVGDCSNCGRVRVKRKKDKKGKIRFSCSISENRFKGKKRSGSRVKKSKEGQPKYWEPTKEQKKREARKLIERCEICGCGPTKAGFHWDHCHVTGKFRGFLCHHCNVGLGFFMDDVENLLCAIEYLRRHPND